MKILITSVGRRGYLVKYFKEAIGELGEIHVSNSSELSPAFTYADAAIVTPLIYDESYISFLMEYCTKNQIDAIISLFDIDLLVLANHKQEFEEIGVKVIVSDAEIIEICNDKWKTYNFLKENGFYTPTTYLELDKALEDIKASVLSYPLILKPRWGMGSISIYEAESEEELKIFYKKIDRQIKKTYLKYESKNTEGSNVLIQEKIAGQEYGLDIINDLDKNYQMTIVKKKFAMRAGETDCAMTIENNILEACGKKLSHTLGHIGNLDVDVFWHEERPYILEMNARFGGGYPFSHAAGANLPRAIIAWLQGERMDASWFEVKKNVISHKDIHINVIKNF